MFVYLSRYLQGWGPSVVKRLCEYNIGTATIMEPKAYCLMTSPADHNAGLFSTLVANDNSRPSQSDLRRTYVMQNVRTKGQGAQKVKTGRPAYSQGYTNMSSGVGYK